MKESTSRVRFRAEALSAHAGVRRRPVASGPPRVPRLPVLALAVLTLAATLAAATVRVPHYVNATVVAADAHTLRALVPASVPARDLPGRPARFLRGHRTAGKSSVTKAERVDTVGALIERGVPADTPIPVLVIELDRGTAPTSGPDRGRSPAGRVAIETARPPLLAVLLSRGE
ncbi:hypothetical protein [Streptomyces sp. NPDC046261]|uniref:hypothetical protein n=1 Tax=Streptomyces sp. NPDC046261 TaxID=3157200 RepID=UPI00340FD34C